METKPKNYVKKTKLVKLPDGQGGEIECAAQFFEIEPSILEEFGVTTSPSFSTAKEANEYVRNQRKAERAIERQDEKIRNKITRRIDSVIELVEETLKAVDEKENPGLHCELTDAIKTLKSAAVSTCSCVEEE